MRSEALVNLMARFVSRINAETLLKRARERSGVTAADLTAGDIASLFQSMKPGLDLFVHDPGQREELYRALRGGQPAVESEEFTVKSEADINLVRGRIGQMVRDLGGDPFIVQKVMTAVSELSRNMLRYAERGTVHVDPLDPPKVGLHVIARDQGPGIPTPVVQQILAGSYRSRTGLGKGIAGVKRLANSFRLDTGPLGTCVDVEFQL